MVENDEPKFALKLRLILDVSWAFFHIVDGYEIGFISFQFIGFGINLLGSEQLTAIHCDTDQIANTCYECTLNAALSDSTVQCAGMNCKFGQSIECCVHSIKPHFLCGAKYSPNP